MKKTIIILVSVIICFSLCACKCEHVYDNGTITTEPTCTETGILTLTCTECNEKSTEIIPVIEHTYDDGTVTAKATCTETGVLTFTCSRCNAKTTDTIAIIDHTYSEEIVKEASYKEEGTVKFTCVNCGDNYTETLPVKDAEVIVTVIEKEDFPIDKSKWIFSDTVRLTVNVENMTNKSIKGVQGVLHISDMFGEEFLSIGCNFTDEEIPANGMITVTELYFEANRFFDNQIKFFQTDFDALQFEYEVTDIVFTN